MSSDLDRSNYALCCIRCNLRKGPNIAGIDPVSKDLVRLYNPRRDRWRDHFLWQGPVLLGLSSIGRATIRVLNMNDSAILEVRSALIEDGVFPPG